MNYDRANLLDLSVLACIEKECFPEDAFSLRLLKNLLTNAKSVIIKVTTPSGKIIGNIIGVRKKENNKTIGRICSLCVLKKYRKKGVGVQLLQLLQEAFCKSGITEVRLEVSTHNEAAKQLYKRSGYQMTNTILRNYYNDGTDAVVMRKNFFCH
jgi:ribosomal-protein-alanine N-acetyltransferase